MVIIKTLVLHTCKKLSGKKSWKKEIKFLPTFNVIAICRHFIACISAVKYVL